jgi:RNA polymerase sigma-70 factor (ECF subfamily)
MLARAMTEPGDANPGSRPGQRAWTLITGGGVASDETLLSDFFGGDSRAFGELVRRHQRLVQSLVRRYVTRPEDAADLAQAAFLRAFAAVRRSLAQQGSTQTGLFRAWLVRIAVNVGKNHARDVGRWRFESAEVLAEAPAVGPDAVALLERAEQRRRVRGAMACLSVRQREVVTLRVDGGLPFKEVAAALRITENNAKVHFHHAVRRLKAAMEGEEA